MLTIVLLLVLGVILPLIGYLLYDRYDFDVLGGICLVVGVLLFIASIVSSLSLINRQARFNYVIERYNNLKAITECYDSNSKDKIEAFTLREDILKMNNLISKHKVNSQSPWVNVWYSEEIGNLEPIKVSHVNELFER